jgi:hypothetical protein
MILPNLPDELLIQISYHLELSKDLSNLVLSCRRLHLLAIPTLYSTFNDHGDPARMFQFLSTILARPDLAAYVKTLISSGPHPYWEEITIFMVDAMSPRLKAELAKMWADERRRDVWYKAMSGGGGQVDAWEAAIAFYMLILPNLSTLGLPRFHDMGDGEARCIPMAVNRAIQLQDSKTLSPYDLRNLRNIEIGLLSDNEGAVHSTSKSFFGLKSIRTVASDFNFCNEPDEISPITGTRPQVTHFSLTRSDIPPSAFATILKPFCNLTHLICSNYGAAEPPFSFYPQELRLGITQLKSTLQELTIVNNQEEIETVDYLMGENEGLPFGSLVEFQKLRRLEGTVRTLVGRRLGDPGFDSDAPKDSPKRSRGHENARFAESLPEALEELVLRACLNDIFVVVEALLERRRRGALKRLKGVTLIFAYGISLDEVVEEGSSCVDQGKKLGIIVKKLEGTNPRS